MKPTLFLGDLTKLTTKKQKHVCKCKPMCEVFIIEVGNEDFFLCKTEALEHVKDIQRLIGGFKFPKEWTSEDEEKVINYMKTHKRRAGSISRLATLMGATENQMRHKIKQLRDEGKLK